jgi:hypothetical protein
VIVQTIAATTTRTGLTVHAELDTGSYPTGVTVSNAALAAVPITRHSFHGDWNYTLHPEPTAPESGGHTNESDPLPPTPPDTATLSHPTLTGLSRPELDTLTAALDELRCRRDQAHHRQHQHHRREHEQREHAPRSGRPPRLAFPDQVVATILHRRLSLPYDTLAVLFDCSRSTMWRTLERTTQLLDQHRTLTQPVTLPDSLANIIAEIKTAC